MQLLANVIAEKSLHWTSNGLWRYDNGIDKHFKSRLGYNTNLPLPWIRALICQYNDKRWHLNGMKIIQSNPTSSISSLYHSGSLSSSLSFLLLFRPYLYCADKSRSPLSLSRVQLGLYMVARIISCLHCIFPLPKRNFSTCRSPQNKGNGATGS